MASESFLLSIGTSIFWKFLDRVLGLLKHIIIAGTIGLSAQLDIFYMVMAFLGVLVFSWSGLMSIVAVPRMVELHTQQRLKEFTALTTGLFSLTLLFSFLLTVLLYLFWDFISSLIIGFDQHRSELLRNAFFWVIPVCLLYMSYNFIGSIARALRNFSTVYQSEFLVGLVVLVAIIVFTDNPAVLLWSFSIGVFCAFVYILLRQYPLITRLGNPFSTEVLFCLKYAPSLLLLNSASAIFVLSDRIFMSFLSEGAVSALAYGMILTNFVPNLLGIHNSFITILSEKKTIDLRNDRLNDVLSIGIYLSVAVGLFMILYREPLIQLLFERGVFNPDDTTRVATAVLGYSFAIPAIMMNSVIFSVYQVERKIPLFVIRILIVIVINIILNAIFLFLFGWGIGGIALATSIASLLQMLMGLQGLARLGYRIAWSRHLKWFLWMTLFMSVIFLLEYIVPVRDFGALMRLSVGCTLILSMLLLAGYTYRGEERVLVRSSVARICSGVNVRLTNMIRLTNMYRRRAVCRLRRFVDS